MRGRAHHWLLAGSALACAGALHAAETIHYSYYRLGRLIRVERSGTVNAGLNAHYRYDCADNRTNVASGPGTPPPPPPPPCPPPPPPPGPGTGAFAASPPPSSQSSPSPPRRPRRARARSSTCRRTNI